MRFTGQETPREVVLALEGEGYWLWEETPHRLIYWDGDTSFWKVSKFPDRPTFNHLDHTFAPEETIFHTPNLAYMEVTSCATHGQVYK